MKLRLISGGILALVLVGAGVAAYQLFAQSATTSVVQVTASNVTNVVATTASTAEVACSEVGVLKNVLPIIVGAGLACELPVLAGWIKFAPKLAFACQEVEALREKVRDDIIEELDGTLRRLERTRERYGNITKDHSNGAKAEPDRIVCLSQIIKCVEFARTQWNIRGMGATLHSTSDAPVEVVKIEREREDFKLDVISITTATENLHQITSEEDKKSANKKVASGQRKIQSQKLQWNARSKIGSLDNASYKPAGGNVKIFSAKLDFARHATSRIGSLDNVKHVASGGNIKVQKPALKESTKSKTGAVDNAMDMPLGRNMLKKGSNVTVK